jgi:hypothetical protein
MLSIQAVAAGSVNRVGTDGNNLCFCTEDGNGIALIMRDCAARLAPGMA